MEHILTVALMMISAVLLILYCRERKERGIMKSRQDDLDAEYTSLLARNMEQEEELLGIRRDYDKQKVMAVEIQKLHEKTRLLKHDMKNHIMVIMSFLDENKIEDAKSYISGILDDLNKMYTYIHVGNALLNYIINGKFKEAAKRGVAVKAEISNLPFEGMESVDFSALLNNLLDNAIEAAEQSEEKKIAVHILEKRGWESICVANTIRESVLTNNPDFMTTKPEEGHGYGMKQISRIVEKYQGLMDIYEEDGYFKVDIMLPASEEFTQ